MSEVLQTNIFFVITSIAVVAVTILIIVLLVYVIKTMRNVSKISDTVRKESEEIVKDVDVLRGEIKEKGASLKGFINFITSHFKRKNHGK